jgi:citrate lyase subunit beta/citryl-CoA lyase
MESRGRLAPRSLFFVPGSRPELLAKVPRWRPDVAVLDLEDAVPAAGKDAARAALVTALAETDLPTTLLVRIKLLVRINPPGTAWFDADLTAVADGPATGVVLPKYESADQLAEVRRRLPSGALVVVGIESARGVADCAALLTGPVDAAYFGAEDYIADLGGRRTPGGWEALYARSQVVLAARLAGVGAIDEAFVDIGDDDGFAADARAGQAMGYTGKICVHPRQVELSHRVFTPTPEEVEHARAVVTAFRSGGVATVDGQMVDEVHVRMARQVLARAEAVQS